MSEPDPSVPDLLGVWDVGLPGSYQLARELAVEPGPWQHTCKLPGLVNGRQAKACPACAAEAEQP